MGQNLLISIITLNSFILTMWYVNSYADDVLFDNGYCFILTMWYVNCNYY